MLINHSSLSRLSRRNFIAASAKSAVALMSGACTSFESIGAIGSEDEIIHVMTFNTYYGGTRRGQPLSQTAKVIQIANADIVGLQESGDETGAIADFLGWNYVRHGWSAIITRFDIVGNFPNGVTVRTDAGHEVFIFNYHLSPAPYQPYQLLNIPYKHAPFIETEEEAIAYAKRARGRELSRALQQIRSAASMQSRVFVTGDFNEPSHLDWTAAAAEAGLHPIKVDFPTSRKMSAEGFKDAWRMLYPEEVKAPGFTWSPLTQADDPEDHHDRIDFVYFKGAGVELKAVKIVGEDENHAHLVVDPYPSDHRAVVARFKLKSIF